jgi:branched-chain amino acid transport system substrate-binding protein
MRVLKALPVAVGSNSALESQISNLKFQIPSCQHRIAITPLLIWSFQLPVPSYRFPFSSFKFLISNFQFQIAKGRFRLALLFLAILLAATQPGLAQSPPTPYGVIPRDGVNYAGPGRDARHDLEGTGIKIGLLAPLTGSGQDEGKALLEAAQLAIEDETANLLPDGRRLTMVPRDQSGPWGRASNEIVRLVYEDQAVAIVTALDGRSAHLAEQIGNKVGIPIVTLSTDPTTTQINLPWIFRLGPTDTQQARAFAHDIYVARALKQVALIMENGHDGRVGGEEFQKAARELNAPAVIRLAIDAADWNPDTVVSQIVAQKPDALVFWTGYETAARLAPRFRRALPAALVYLCHEAAQGSLDSDHENTWIVNSRSAASPLQESFERRYRARAGTLPSPAAAQAYDALRLLAAALRRSGPNRARLRDALATLPSFTGVSGVIAFDHAGNDLGDVTLVRLP